MTATFRILYFSLVVLLLPATLAHSQTVLPTTQTDDGAAVVVPDNLSPEMTRELVSKMSDREVRELLLQRLDAIAKRAAQPEENAAGITDFAQAVTLGIGNSALEAVKSLPDLSVRQAEAFATFYESRGASGTVKFLGLTLLAVACGLLAAWLAQRAMGRWKSRIAAATGREPLGETLRMLGMRLLADASGLIAFIIVTRLVVINTMTGDDASMAKLFILSLVALPLAMAALTRFLSAPHQPKLRLVHTDDQTSLRMYRHAIFLGLLVGFQLAILEFNARNGVNFGELRLGFWLNLAILGYVAYITFTLRDGLKLMMRGRDTSLSRGELWVANAYPYAVIVGCGLTWLLVEYLVSQEQFHLLDRGQHYLTLWLLIMAPTLDTMVRGLVRHLVPPMKGEGVVAEEAFKATHRSYIHIGRLLVFGLVLFTVAKIWNIDFHNLASAGFGARVAAALIEALVIVAIGFLAYEIASLWINRKLSDEMTARGIDLNADEPGGGEGGGVGGSRLSTVLPLLRLVLLSSIVVITFLLALGNIGVDITPLLAGAGIVGLAIGFGAQKLVADVVSGVFFLVDDAFRVGEYVDIEGTLGTVEKISIRSLQLRHHRGAVHTIPFGEIPKITNYSRDWVIMKMRFTVPFDTDLNKVKKIFKKIGKDMAAIPEYAEDMLQPFKSQGVLEVDDVGIVVRGKFMAKPGKQFTLRKEIYSRVQQAFDQNGIEFARREVRVNIGSDPSLLTEEDKQAVAAAATATPEAKPA